LGYKADVFSMDNLFLTWQWIFVTFLLMSNRQIGKWLIGRISFFVIIGMNLLLNFVAVSLWFCMLSWAQTKKYRKFWQKKFHV